MSSDLMTVTNDGGYTNMPTPWDDPSWRVEARTWAEKQLAERGLRRAEDEGITVRLRPWSVVISIPLAGGAGVVWFKANPPGAAFETGLGAALAELTPRQVLHPLAVDTERAWSLLPDGGRLFSDVLNSEPAETADTSAWEEPLRQYGEFQRELSPHLDRLAGLGVLDLRTPALPGCLDQLLTECTALEPAERKSLLALRPQFAEWCAELAESGVADSLDHSDLHEAQIFVPGPATGGRYAFFDWGDASLAHPFTSLLVVSRVVRERYGPARSSEVLPRLRDVYLEPWTDVAGRNLDELRRAAHLACRLGAVGRSVSWGRLFPGVHEDWHKFRQANMSGWLGEMLTEPLL
jgi:hypothetical protein